MNRNQKLLRDLLFCSVTYFLLDVTFLSMKLPSLLQQNPLFFLHSNMKAGLLLHECIVLTIILTWGVVTICLANHLVSTSFTLRSKVSVNQAINLWKRCLKLLHNCSNVRRVNQVRPGKLRYGLTWFTRLTL